MSTRKHSIEKIFPFSADSNEIMLYGNVEYGLKNGKEVVVEWAGRAVLVEEGGSWKMSFYQVYMDAGAVGEAMRD